MAKISFMASLMKPMLPSKALSVIVGEKPILRTEVTKKVWDYIKIHKLQDQKERRNINCDNVLRSIFNNKKVVSMFEMAKYLNQNLSYPQAKTRKNMSKKTQFKVGDRVEITARKYGHAFNIGDIVEIYAVSPTGSYQARNAKANWSITSDECKLATTKNSTTQMANSADAVRKGLVLACAQTLLSPNNTVTTLEIKTELRKTQPQYYWTQDVVSKIMDEFSTAKVFTYTDNGTFRTYSDPSRKATIKVPTTRKTVAKKPATKSNKTTQKYSSTITKAQALKMMQNNKGHFFTATFIKTDGTTRIMNCQYLAGQTPDKTSVKVREACLMKSGDAAIRQITLDRLKELKIAGSTHKVGRK